MQYRPSINCGIDAGLTNAALAVSQGVSVRMVKTNTHEDRIPSCVDINRRGHLHTGTIAMHRLGTAYSQCDIYMGFTHRLATDHQYNFISSCQSMRPEELAGETIPSVPGSTQQRLGDDVLATVWLRNNAAGTPVDRTDPARTRS